MAPLDTTLARLGREERMLCLGARTRPAAAATAELGMDIQAGPDWARLWALGHRHEVLPLLAESLPAAAATTAHGASIPSSWLADADRRRLAVLAQNGAVAETLGAILDALGAADVPVIPVKGLVTALRWYGGIATRPAADIDLLVRPDDLPRAQAALRSGGLERPDSSRFQDLVHDFHDVPWVAAGRYGPIVVELHWSLWSQRAHPADLAPFWARAQHGRLLDRDVLLLDPVDALLHLAIHRTRSALRLRWIVDVAELVASEGDTLDWDRLVATAGALQARTATWSVLDLAWRLLDAPVPAGVRAALCPSLAKVRLLERTCGVPALFRRVDDDDLGQQPHLTVRLLEQDGARRIARNLAWSLRRTSRRVMHERGIRTMRVASANARGGRTEA